MSDVHPDPISLSFHESLLRLSDVQLLKGPYWLNDQIISFYFEYLEKFKYQSNKDMLFISPEVTQCLKIVPVAELDLFLSPLGADHKPYIFFPLNDNESQEAGGTHWSLLIFSRNEQNFYHFDSSNNLNLWHCQQFVKKIKSSLNCNDAICTPVLCLQQTNNYDCGVHVICMTDHISEYINRFDCIDIFGQISHDTVIRKRGDILKIIKSLGGKFS